MDSGVIVGQAVGVFTDYRLRVERDWEHCYNFQSDGHERWSRKGGGGVRVLEQRPKECDKALQGKKECAEGLRKNKKLEWS